MQHEDRWRKPASLEEQSWSWSVRGDHHWLWPPPQIDYGALYPSGSPSLDLLVSWIPLGHTASYDLIALVSLDIFCYLFWSTRPQNLHSTSTTWITKSKSAKTSKTSETKHNSRNKGINYTIKHINPLI